RIYVCSRTLKPEAINACKTGGVHIRISRATWLGFDLPLLFGRGVIRRMCGVPLPCGGLRRTETPCFA
ncbi:MAG: hypothetical protein ABL884_12560, partial [Methyloglobulus sp.]